VVDLIGPPADREAPKPAQIVFTSGQPPSPALVAALSSFGLSAAERRFDSPPLSA